jgi:CheY-like chemotaxis protein
MLRDILVIDDEPLVTQAVVKVCRAEGMTVRSADHAAEALRCLEDNRFRLVLCDIMMHGLDGFQFLEELARRGIRKCGQKPDVDGCCGLYSKTVHLR